ncbi:MAG: 8-amino-7-oxononanoate synthase [Deltaproteobacteria bacterium]|nr:8-amino-7-oxononanoate synthase [Deltaproteobacteria bacterium]
MRSIFEELEKIQHLKLDRTLKEIHSDQSSTIQCEGKTFLNFSSNNYLGLANDPRLKEASIQAIQEYGTSSGASRLITGSMSLHHRLEEEMAVFKRSQSSLLFNSGYHANLGLITALIQEGDEIYSDALNHASLIDGARLSRGKINVYRHNDVDHLESLLKASTISSQGRRLIITDSVFSMDGDLAPLQDLANLAEKYEAWLMVDEAHGTGVLGKNGAGLVEEVWPEERPAYLKEFLIQMGTYGKALGSFGAYVAGTHDLRKLMINRARAFIYTTSLPPAVVAASRRAMELVKEEPQRREALQKNIQFFTLSLGRGIQGEGRGHSSERSLLPGPLPRERVKISSAIFPILVGSSEKALEYSRRLFDKGFWVTPIRYPTVAAGTERLRVTVMATHHPEQIQSLAEVLNECIRD